jgi:hypothetical protein
MGTLAYLFDVGAALGSAAGQAISGVCFGDAAGCGEGCEALVQGSGADIPLMRSSTVEINPGPAAYPALRVRPGDAFLDPRGVCGRRAA